ncbi:tetratricopeptide repeat protein [Methanofollis tationis]|uniref:Tetratricopeptide repeat protein n=1 Tax=Methanofollis tationis TaxID=81417 RepID=A0A7K4HQF9_9EURY|nr:tetratricopeptide repeat protein [Methanofollis tationis]NVO67505.1 tetratricopeptide repeat protein [Methanofollis tationis]
MVHIPPQKRYALGWYNEGVTHLSMREYEEALSFFDRALRAVPDHPDFLVGKGEVLMAVGDYYEAYQLFIQAATSEPENIRALVMLGNVLLKLDRSEPADEAFLAALTLNRYEGEAWLGHGIACHLLGKDEDARTAFQKAMNMSPNQPELMYYLAKTARTDNEAIEYLMRGCRLDPENIDLLTEMAERLIRLGRYREAALFCTKAEKRCPGNTRIEALIGQCMDAMMQGEGVTP